MNTHQIRYESNYLLIEEALANLRSQGFKINLSSYCNELICSRQPYGLDTSAFDKIEKNCFGSLHQYFIETILYGPQPQHYRIRRSRKPPEKRFSSFRLIALIHPLAGSMN